MLCFSGTYQTYLEAEEGCIKKKLFIAGPGYFNEQFNYKFNNNTTSIWLNIKKKTFSSLKWVDNTEIGLFLCNLKCVRKFCNKFDLLIDPQYS